jgi:hypothetical protein
MIVGKHERRSNEEDLDVDGKIIVEWFEVSFPSVIGLSFI